MRNLAIAAGLSVLLLLSTAAHAQTINRYECCVSSSIPCVVPPCVSSSNALYCSNSPCIQGNYDSRPAEPASSKAPEENLQILLDRAKADVKEQEGKWFSSGSSLSAAREKVAVYRALLDQVQPQR